jgi:eukaryotic-like serine/threonine-protein kinase
LTVVGLLSQPLIPEPTIERNSNPPVAPLSGDYLAELKRLLEEKEWEDADLKTLDIMLRVTRRESSERLDDESIPIIPCKVLKEIDQLWKQYSDDRFGFSVQHKIWQESGSPIKPNADWAKFGNRVGWRVDGMSGRWHGENEIFLSNPPRKGGLPWGGYWFGDLELSGWWYLFPHIEDCEL